MNIKLGQQEYPKNASVKKHEICSDPISADPSCPFPRILSQVSALSGPWHHLSTLLATITITLKIQTIINHSKHNNICAGLRSGLQPVSPEAGERRPCRARELEGKEVEREAEGGRGRGRRRWRGRGRGREGEGGGEREREGEGERERGRERGRGGEGEREREVTRICPLSKTRRAHSHVTAGLQSIDRLGPELFVTMSSYLYMLICVYIYIYIYIYTERERDTNSYV